MWIRSLSALLLRLVAGDVRIAENDAAPLGLGQRIARAFRNHGALLLRERRIDVQHERVHILAERRDAVPLPCLREILQPPEKTNIPAMEHGSKPVPTDFLPKHFIYSLGCDRTASDASDASDVSGPA